MSFMQVSTRAPSPDTTATPQRFLTVSSWMATGALLSVARARSLRAVVLVYLAQVAAYSVRPLLQYVDTTRLLASVLAGSGQSYCWRWVNGKEGTVTAVAREVLVGGAAS